MKIGIAIFSIAVLILGVTACADQDTTAGDNEFAIIQNIELTEDQIVDLAQELLSQFNIESMFDVPDFFKPDDFGVELGSGVDWERLRQVQASGSSRESAEQEAVNFFEWRYGSHLEHTIEFIGENEYYYAFRIIYEQEMRVSPVEGSHFGVPVTSAARYIVYKDSAVYFTSDGVPQITSQMRNRDSIRDILDTITFFYARESFFYGRHPDVTRIINRQIAETADHGGGFIYIYHFIDIVWCEQTTSLYAEFGAHHLFIDRDIGAISVLLSEVIRAVRLP